jgi:hypothetical protein
MNGGGAFALPPFMCMRVVANRDILSASRAK